ncbi:EAL domain-containing response regulator [Prochlorothrix hollandica]|uniref:EAL domain-containing response regulator n=1 Tax=Prochlorothrix hollandica TaxID=1223 RepID=UPI00333F7968
MTPSTLGDRPKGDILIVDDTPNNLRVLHSALTDQGYKVRSVTNGRMALTVAETAQPHLILLDIRMPDWDGYEVCQRLKANTKTQDIPVIFLSALDEVFDKVKAFQVGGVDYVTKPFHMEEVLVRVKNQLQLQAAQAAIHQLNGELEQRVRQRTAQLEQEIVERQQAQQKLLHMALHDPLTGLPNRVWFLKQLAQTLEQVRQYPSLQFTVLLLDCDRFRIINDSLGHAKGDQLLVAMARRLESCLRPGHTLCRLGGDEFVILLQDVSSEAGAIQVAQGIQQDLALSFQLGQDEIFTNVSIGIVLACDQYHEPEHVLRDADAAMYQAKARGKTHYQVFDRSMHDHALSRLVLEMDLRRAIDRQELMVYYQPIVDLQTLQIKGFEALVRWQHPQRGMISPLDFIPVAEETGLIVTLGTQVLQLACQQLQTWKERWTTQGVKTECFDLRINVNLSVRQFTDRELLHNLDQILYTARLDSHHVVLEITESALIDHDAWARTLFDAFKSRQIQVAIDDFGTGYSSLSYLQRFATNILKIDRSFITKLPDDSDTGAIVKAIITLAHHLGMTVVAEGIETPEQVQHLRALGCDRGQGYWFSRPLSSEAATQLVFSNTTSPVGFSSPWTMAQASSEQHLLS